MSREVPTVYRALKFLPADLAVEPSAARLLVKLNFNRLFMVAEKTCKSRRKGVALSRWMS